MCMNYLARPHASESVVFSKGDGPANRDLIAYILERAILDRLWQAGSNYKARAVKSR